MILFLYIIFPFLCVAAIKPAKRQDAFAERLVFGLALYEFLLFLTGVSLGLLNLLTKQAYVAVTLCLVIFLLIKSWRNGIHVEFTPIVRRLRTRRGMAIFLLFSLLAVAFILQLAFDFLTGTRHYDGLWYHIPRVIFWAQQNNFDAWTTPGWGQNGLPVGADVILGQKILLGGGWAGTGYVTLMLSIGAIACVYIAAIDLRLPRWHALMAAILFGSFPVIGMRIWTVNSDIAAAFPILAAYIVLLRVHNLASGLAFFLLLNGLAIACKPTVAPHAMILGIVGFWQCRQRIFALHSFAKPCIAGVLAIVIVFSSYLPVYNAFQDFQGGDVGRRHKVSTATEFAQATAMSAVHWVAEPLGYFNSGNNVMIKSMVIPIYDKIGGDTSVHPESWIPTLSQDLGRSGLASVLILPILIAGFKSRTRYLISIIFLLAFISLSGIVQFKPWNARYTIILLAGYALLWAGAKQLRKGYRRWLIVGLAGLNICAIIGVTCIIIYKDITIHSQPDGNYSYIEEKDRKMIANSLEDRPLLVISPDGPDALLVGSNIEFKMKYLTCPTGNDWGIELRNAATQSDWLAVVHRGYKTLETGPDLHRPGVDSCEPISKDSLEVELLRAGWTLYKSNQLLDLWTRLTE